MCHIFAGQNPTNYSFITRSIRISGHATSVRLESKFWDIVDTIAAAQDMSTPQFLSLVHEEAEQLHGEVSNFASLLRCACLVYLEEPNHTMASAHAENALARDHVN